MKTAPVLATALLLSACATHLDGDFERVCAVVRATPNDQIALPDGFDQTDWQSIALRSNETWCAERRLLSGLFYRYPQVGFSTDGGSAILLVDSGSGAFTLGGSRCYLRRDDDSWRVIGCEHEWEF